MNMLNSSHSANIVNTTEEIEEERSIIRSSGDEEQNLVLEQQIQIFPGQETKPDDKTSSSSSGERLEFEIKHRARGRLRLRVHNLADLLHGDAGSLIDSIFFHGVLAVRCNSWCGSVAIEYDPHVWSEEALLKALSELQLNPQPSTKLSSPVLKVYREPVPVRWLRVFAHAMERLLPPPVQLILGGAAFAAGILEFPLLATRILMAASTVPIATRALSTAVNEHKIGIDALDGTAATLMIANGKMVEASFMVALISLGEFIRDKTARRCERMVTDLLGLSGRSAWLIKGSKRLRVSADDVQVGDTVVVYPGDMVPVDGVVLRGQAAIDQAKMTGESIPVEVKAGDQVLAATALVEGKIYVRCEASGSQTKAGLVLQSVTCAPLHETKIENHASELADKVVLPMFAAATVCFVITRDIARLMSMLVLDFCTGIRIAAPTAILSAMHRAGRRGILIKSGAALEKLASVSAIVFDKTGTLTSGEPVVEQVSRFNGRTEDEVLALAASVEMRLHHPAARAIVKAAQQRGLNIAEQDESKFSRGMGAKAMVGGQEVIVGSKSMMQVEGIEIEDAHDSEMQATNLGESVAFVAIDRKVAGLIRYKDRLRPEVVAAMAELKKMGISKLVMATGDTQEAAERIAKACGITEVIARAFPEDKAQLVQKLKADGHTVAVIGDGINDSPALAYADVAISLHGATDAAREGADLVLTDDNLQRLPEGIRIARSALSLVKQNLVMAVVPNSAGFALAAAGLLGPAGATILNNGAAMAAAINGLRPLISSDWSKETVEQK